MKNRGSGFGVRDSEENEIGKIILVMVPILTVMMILLERML